MLACIKRYNPEYYSSLFEKNYPNILKIDRLYLWLNNLNSYYNYLELVQSAWQLSNDELLNASRQVEERRLQLGSHGSRMNVQPPMVSPPPMGPPPVVRSELEVEIGYAVRRLRAALRELRLDTERACAGPHTLAVPHPIRGPFVLWCC
jgi:hypothetical protein